MRNLIPAWLLERMQRFESSGRAPAAALLVDVVGFTAATDALAVRGDLGAEQLAALLDGVFDPLIATVDAHGGFVSTFSGDGFTAIFPAELPDECGRATAAALAMCHHMAHVTPFDLPEGEHTPLIRVGVGNGELEWSVVSSPTGDRAAYLMTGSAPLAATTAEQTAEPGVVTVTDGVAQRLGSGFDKQRIGDFWAVTAGPLVASSVARSVTSASGHERPFYPDEVFTWDRPAEYRQVVSAFVNVDAAVVESAIQLIFELQGRHGGLLSPPEFADKGCVLMVLWGAPIGLEDDLMRALRFARELAGRLPRDARIGVSYGTVFAGFVGSSSRQQYTSYGSSVNLAARLMGIARWGEVMLDGAAAERAGSAFEIEPRGEMQLKGFAQPRRAFLLGPPRAQQHMRTHLVARTTELDQLVERLDALFASGAKTTVLVEGEPGIGKSRLVAEARQRSAADSAWFLCPADARSDRALGHWRRLAEQIFDQQAGADVTENRAAFSMAWDALTVGAPGRLAEQLAPYRSFLQAFVDLLERGSPWETATPQQRAARTAQGLIALLGCLAAVEPVVLEFEDLQWADPATLQLLGEVCTLSLPLGIVITTRPLEDPPDFADLHLRLGRLTTSELAEMAEGILHATVSEEFAVWLAERCGGNPFYAEQVIHLLRDQDLLTTAEPLSLEQPNTAVPSDVRAVVVARLDALEPGVRTAIQLGSIFGRDFEPAALSLMLEELEPPLTARTVAAATASRTWSDAPGGLLRFDHAMVQEAAYEMQLRATRQSRHALAAHAIKRLHHEALDPHYAALAFHHQAAGDIPVAVDDLRRAGSFALRSGHQGEAERHAERGLELLSAVDGVGPDVELGLQSILGVSRMATAGQAAPDTLAPYQRALELSATSGDSVDTFQALFGVRTHYLFRGDHGNATALADRGLEIAERLDDVDLLMEAHLNKGNSHFWAGELADAVDHLRWVCEHYEEEMHYTHLVQFAQNPRITATFPLAHSLWLLGRGDEAETLTSETVAMATELDHAFSIALAVQTEAFLQCHLRRPDRVVELASHLIELAEREGFPVYVPVGSIPLGWAQARQGDAGGLETIGQASDLLRSRGMNVSRTLFAALIADAALSLGDATTAAAQARQAAEWGATNGELAFIPELRRLEALADPVASDALRTRALQESERQESHAWSYRIRADMAQELAASGQSKLAFDTLTVVAGSIPPSHEDADRVAALRRNLERA